MMSLWVGHPRASPGALAERGVKAFSHLGREFPWGLPLKGIWAVLKLEPWTPGQGGGHLLNHDAVWPPSSAPFQGLVWGCAAQIWSI